MRSIFFLVLAANIIFFSHQYFIAITPEVDQPRGAARMSDSTGRGLFLLSERTEVEAPKKVKAKTSPPGRDLGNEIPPDATLCTMIGPYEQLLQAEYAVEHLSALGADVHIAPLEIKEGDSFWVYLNPEVSEREALNRLYELQKKNIESHIISKGELMNGISLGRYSRYEDAESRVQSIKTLGYEAQIKIIPKTIQETWVVVAAGSAEKLDSSVWVMLMEKQKGLEKRKNYCLGVASP